MAAWVNWRKSGSGYSHRVPIWHRRGKQPGRTLCNQRMPAVVEEAADPPQFHRCMLCARGLNWSALTLEVPKSYEREGN